MWEEDDRPGAEEDYEDDPWYRPDEEEDDVEYQDRVSRARDVQEALK